MLADRIETVPIAELKPHPRNPRRGDVDAIAESLKVTGQFRPLLVQRSTRRVLAGNHTLAAAQQLGWAMIAIVQLDVDDAVAERVLLADNRLADLASWDDTDLVASLQSLDDLTGTGFTDTDLDVLLASLNVADDDDDKEHEGRAPANEVKFQTGTLSWTIPRGDWDWFYAGLTEKVGTGYPEQVAELRSRLGC